MTTYFVSRHAGSLAWIAGKLPQPHHVTHLDVAAVRRGDVVAGTLPVHLAAEACRRGARFYHLALDTRPDERGAELSAEALEARGARLVRYEVREVAEDGRWRRLRTKVGDAVGRPGGADLVFLGVLAAVALTLLEVALVKATGTPKAAMPVSALLTATKPVAALAAMSCAALLAWAWHRHDRVALGTLVVSALVLAQAGMFELVKTAVTSIAGADASGSAANASWLKLAGPPLAQAGVVFTIVVVLALLIYHWRHSLIRTTISRIRVPPKRVLIMGLSDLAGEGGRNLDSNLTSLQTARGFPLSVLALSADEAKDEQRPLSEDDRKKLTSIAHFPWQQNLRAIKPHIGVLEHVIIVTSARSQPHLRAFTELLEGLTAETGKLSIHALPTPADFEDYDDLVGAFSEALMLARQVGGAYYGDVCIDATAGQKIFSIAAAIVTLNKNLVFTYVNNLGKVRAYDASVALGEFS